MAILKLGPPVPKTDFNKFNLIRFLVILHFVPRTLVLFSSVVSFIQFSCTFGGTINLYLIDKTLLGKTL